MKKLKYRLIVFGIMVFFLLVLFIYSFNTLVPIINARAVQYSRTHATKIIGTAIKNVLDEKSLNYSDLITLNTDNEGNILSLSSDIVNINSLKSNISLEIAELLADEKNSILKIPIGNLSGLYIFSGRGFGISVRLIPTSSALTSVESDFSEVGINQSWHRINVKVTLRLGIIVLGKHTYIDVTDTVPVADTVIVGKVPDAYTRIEKLNSEDVGDIVDFMAQ